MEHCSIEAFPSSSHLTPGKHKYHNSVEKTVMIIDFLWFDEAHALKFSYIFESASVTNT